MVLSVWQVYDTDGVSSVAMAAVAMANLHQQEGGDGQQQVLGSEGGGGDGWLL